MLIITALSTLIHSPMFLKFSKSHLSSLALNEIQRGKQTHLDQEWGFTLSINTNHDSLLRNLKTKC